MALKYMSRKVETREVGSGSYNCEKSGSGKASISDEDWEELDDKAASAIRLCLAKNVLANVGKIPTMKELWEKLEKLYQTKSISNRLYLKERFHTLRMAEEERRLSSESTETTDVSALAVVGNWKKGSASGSKSDTDSIASGCVVEFMSIADKLPGRPTWKLHHKFQQDISTCVDVKFLELRLPKVAGNTMSQSSAAKTKGRSVVEDKLYPAPLSSHEDVSKDPIVFWDTLRRFHFIMGTKFMIPVIGGKELDLHVLYVEATTRGGYEKVVAEKKWREVGAVFKFSPTTTSASFVLRKHYLTLLYHYEQVHFFKMQGPPCVPSAASFSVHSPSCRPGLALVEYSPKRINDHPDSHIEAVGRIDGKFDCGYLVSVKLGSETLSGVLYHPDHPGPSTSFCQSNDVGAIIPYTPNSKRRYGRRRRSKRRGDPSYPKPNRSGYNFFFAEKHYKLKSLYPNREREFTKMIGESWTNLSPEERKVYQNIGLKDKERYNRELKEYKERLKLRQGEGANS
ncbi:High mobility group B protein 9 [Citrus sinensis]|nr:High mobility group B protein 9 [Citrus sinensis]